MQGDSILTWTRRLSRGSVLILAIGAGAAGAQDVGVTATEILLGEVQRVILQPSGTADCPPQCPPDTLYPDGSRRICILTISCLATCLGSAGPMSGKPR